MSILLEAAGDPVEGWAAFEADDLHIPAEADVPSCLKPTSLQNSIPHEAWIDVLPYPALRDNIIKNQDTLDTDALCDDFMGGMYEGLSEVENRGMILWGEPWSKNGWELSESFVRKWFFLLSGCEDLVASTNKWRAARCEDRLVMEI